MAIAGDLDAAGDVTIAADAGTLSGEGAIGGGSLDLQAASINLSGDLTGGDITLASLAGDLDFAAASGNIIDATSAGAVNTNGAISGDSVSLTAATNASVNDTITSGGALDVTATAGDVAIAGDLDAAGDVTIAADAGTLSSTTAISGGSLDLHGGDVNLSGDITGGDIAIQAIQGDVLLATADAAGDFGATAQSGSVTTQGQIEAESVGIVGWGGVQIGGRVESDTYLSIVSLADVMLGGELDAGQSVSVNAVGSLEGDLAIQGGAVELAAGAVDLGGDITADAGQLAIGLSGTGDVQLRGSLQATGGDVRLTGGSGSLFVDGNVASTDSIAISGDVSLGGFSGVHVRSDLNAGGDITIAGADTVALESVALTADGNVEISDSNVVSLNGTTVRSTSGDVWLMHHDQTRIESASTIDAAGDVSLLGSDGVGAVNLAGGDLAIQSGGDTNVIATIDGDAALVVTAEDWIQLGGDVGDETMLKSITLDGDAVVLGGTWQGTDYSIGAVRASGDISLNASSGSLASSGLPSIFGFGDSLIVQSELGDLSIGANQGLSFAGNLILDASQTLTVGDVTATGDLTLEGGQVDVMRRGALTLLQPGGSIVSPQTSVVSGQTLTIEGELAFTGSGEDPLFGGVVDAKGVPLIDRAAVDPFSAASLELGVGGRERMALKALNGFTPSPEPGDEIAAESQQGEVIVELATGQPDLRTVQLLADLGVEIVDSPDRPAGTDRLARAGHVVNDYQPGTPALGDRSAATLIQVSRSRLDPQYVRDAVANYSLALESAPDQGSLSSAAGIVTKAREAYAAASADERDPVPFRTWLTSEDPSGGDTVSVLLSRLDRAFEDLRRAGLTAAEVDASRRFVMHRLTATQPKSADEVAVGAASQASSS